MKIIKSLFQNYNLKHFEVMTYTLKIIFNKILILGMLSGCLFMSCSTLKPYQKIYVNDSEMQMSLTARHNFENYIQSIREGAISTGSKKGNGGCGCN